jgi:type I restriction enzyme M protein
MSNIDYAEKLTTLRSKLGISQEELASRLNVSFATVNRWENGKVEPQKAVRQTIERMITEVEGGSADSMINTGARKKRGVQKSQVLSTRSMEQMLWSAACSIRGEKDAPKFKD